MWSMLAGSAICATLSLAGTFVSPRWTEVKQRRTWEYAATGAAGALLGGALAAKLAGLSPAFFFYAVLGAVLVTASLVDLHDRIIPNELVLFTLGAGLVLLLVAPGGALAGSRLVPWASAGIGAVSGGGLLLLLALLYGGRGMGLGDVKLQFAIGLYLGWPNTAVGLMIAFILGGVVSLALLLAKVVGRKDHIPFGPFLAAGALAAVFWGEAIVRELWYFT